MAKSQPIINTLSTKLQIFFYQSIFSSAYFSVSLPQFAHITAYSGIFPHSFEFSNYVTKIGQPSFILTILSLMSKSFSISSFRLRRPRPLVARATDALSKPPASTPGLSDRSQLWQMMARPQGDLHSYDLLSSVFFLLLCNVMYAIIFFTVG